jgi:hypothetical protein
MSRGKPSQQSGVVKIRMTRAIREYNAWVEEEQRKSATRPDVLRAQIAALEVEYLERLYALGNRGQR